MEIIYAIIAAIVAVFGAYKIGATKAKSKVEADNRITQNNRETTRLLDANRKATEKQINVANNVTKVQNEINTLDDGAVLRELREKYSRD